MEEVKNSAEKGTQTVTEGKTFTQDDVNRIVQERLAKDRAKASEDLDKREEELRQKEFRLDSRQKLIDRGYPESIMEALNCSSKEAFDKALDIIDGLIKERTPSKEEKELEEKKARFTQKMDFGNPLGERDTIRKAMKLI